ncbi:tetratricopeptide repeat protein [Alkanindiges sp. WGS2144]|uniref:tetratricopeptide repeat protein n=1 Tax=Alkanindiges sp. WGS2144 TaxID=3366808 RepID=UPI003752F9E8
MKKQISILMLSLGLLASTANAELIMNPGSVNAATNYATMAVPALHSAAKAGSAPAQFYLATRYKLGQGVSTDLTQAFAWYKKAADQGVSAAQLNVGQMYAEGRGVKQDMNAAKLWLQKAAKQGDNRASYNLALIEERNQNLSSAYQWYELASRDGMLDRNVSKQAQGKIVKLAANLSQQDILAARDRADRWFQTEQ